MYIALDAQAGDYGTIPNLKGALDAVRNLNCRVILVGGEEILRLELKKLGYVADDKLEIVNSAPPVPMDAEPARIAKEYPDSSIMVCADLVAKGKASALISAGNSGATMVASLAKMKRIKNITRPAIAFSLPTAKGFSVILDGGANTDCKPRHLVEFALMGIIYAKHSLGLKNPSVGILSVGEEESKGNTLVRESIPLLKQTELNFYGPIEGRDIPYGTTDVIVCDGFTGNIILKFGEGLARALIEEIKKEVSKKLLYKAGAFMAKNAFKSVKKRMDPDYQGGAPLLGVDGISFICHGKSNETAIFNGIRNCCELVNNQTNKAITRGIGELNDILEKTTVEEALSYGPGV